MDKNLLNIDQNNIILPVAGLLFSIFLGFWGRKALKISIFFTAIVSCFFVAPSVIPKQADPFNQKVLYLVIFIVALILGSVCIKFIDISTYLATGAVGFFAFHYLVNIPLFLSLVHNTPLKPHLKYFPFVGFFLGAVLFWIFKKRIFILLTSLGSGILFDVSANSLISIMFPGKGYEQQFYAHPGLGILATGSFFLHQNFQSAKDQKAKNKNRV
jgi:hypothetical protein